MPSIEIKINSKEKTPEERAKTKKVFHTAAAIISYVIAIIFGFFFLVLHFGSNNNNVVPETIFMLIAMGFWFLGVFFWDKDHEKKKPSSRTEKEK